MNNNPIKKIHVGWTNTWSDNLSTAMPKSVREWVAVCPKCKLIIKAKQAYYYDTSPKKTRKLAKDALHRHMQVFH